MPQKIVIANNGTNLRFEYVQGDDTIAVTEKGSTFPLHLIIVPKDSRFTEINTAVNAYLYSGVQAESGVEINA